jgi:hypothetical protein
MDSRSRANWQSYNLIVRRLAKAYFAGAFLGDCDMTSKTYSASYPIPQKMMDTINNCTLGLGGVGIVGGAIGPGADLIVIAPTWVGMTCTLAAQAGDSMEEDTAKKIAIAVATDVGGFVIGSKIAATVAGWLLALPSAGLSLGLSMAGNAALNAKMTDA